MSRGWAKVSLGKVAELKNGYAFKSQQYAASGPYRVITISNVQDGRLDSATCKYLDRTPDDLKEFQMLEAGDMLISMTGNVGRVCKVLESGFLLNQRVGKIIPISIDNDFLYSVLSSDSFREEMIELAQGGAQPNLSVGDILDYAFECPSSIAEQRKIAEILRTWDEAIETAEAELKAKQELLKRAVAKYFEKAYRDATSGKVGKLKTLDAVCTRKGEYGAAVSACPYNPEWPRYIRITDITETGILKKERAVSISPESAEGYSLKMGDLLFARTGEPGRCLIFNEAYLAAFAGYLIRFKARPEVTLPEYVYFYTLSSVYDKWVGDVSQKGAQANINAKVYGSLQLPVTDLNSQEAAVRVFKALQESVLLAEQGAELLRTQKRGLMQKLLTGEVRVAA